MRVLYRGLFSQRRQLTLFRSTNPRRNSIVQEYILPDFSINRQGRVRKDQENMEDSYQILYMNNERFSVPEILFRPDDIGMYGQYSPSDPT